MENTFYCIKLINPNGERGWLWDSPDGIKIIIGGMHSDIKQFETEKAAQQFIRDKKLERRGVKAYVRTNQDIVNEISLIETRGASIISDKPMFHLENEKGEKLFYDSKQQAYYFKPMGDFGFPIWDDEKKIMQFIREMEFREGIIFLIKHDKGKKQRKIVQV